MKRDGLGLAVILALGLTASGNAYAAAAIDIEKSVADYFTSPKTDVNADTEATALVVAAGATLEFFFYVRNVGDIALSNVTIKDDGVTLMSGIGLDPGAWYLHTALGTAPEGLGFDIGTVSGQWFDDIGSQVVTDSDPAYYRGVAQVSEPATLALFGLGLAGIGAMRRKKLAA